MKDAINNKNNRYSKLTKISSTLQNIKESSIDIASVIIIRISTPGYKEYTSS